ncbi:TetR/AcrR family transcriptional regulator [Paraburkholderia sp. SIMBA_030]|uniref:TetR/AcrR family transcriptional regulator n=1 Tax=Paraburkholderia sp. SIMBA_030 TaxID=3085773 RepID=UPI00397D3FC0
MWKAMVDDLAQRDELESDSLRVARSAIHRKNGRRPQAATGDLRNIILEAAVALFYREPIESLNLDRLADQTGLGKRHIYRIFGSRKAFLQAYADLLCDRERAQWRAAGHRSGEEPVQHLLELFIDVAVELASDDYPPGQPQLSAVQFADQDHPVRLSRTKLGQEFRALLIRLAIAANAVDAEALADTLMMLWENATSNFKSGGDSRRVAQRLPTLVDHIIKSYVVL